MIEGDKLKTDDRSNPPNRDDFGPETDIDSEKSRTRRRLDRLRGVIAKRQPDLQVVLENVHDRHNVSAVLRSCDAVGVDTVHLLYTVEELPVIGSSSSAGVAKWINLVHHPSVDDCFQSLRKDGCTILATSLKGKPRSLYSVDLTGPVVMIFGNEHRGVSDEVIERSDGTIRIPMIGFVESLNISVACAVSLYEAYRQRDKEGLYDQPRMSTQEIEERLDLWSKR